MGECLGSSVMRESSSATRGCQVRVLPEHRATGRAPAAKQWPNPQLASSHGHAYPAVTATLPGGRGRVREHPREAEQLAHGLLAVGVLADPQREVIGRDRAEI